MGCDLVFGMLKDLVEELSKIQSWDVSEVDVYVCCLLFAAWPSVVIFLLELEEKRTKVRGGAD